MSVLHISIGLLAVLARLSVYNCVNVCVSVCVHFFCGHFSRAGEGDEDGEGDEEGFPQRRVFMRWVFRLVSVCLCTLFVAFVHTFFLRR